MGSHTILFPKYFLYQVLPFVQHLLVILEPHIFLLIHFLKSLFFRLLESSYLILQQCIANLQKIRDIDDIVNGFENLEFLDGVTVENVELGEGVVNIQLSTKQELFNNVLEEKSGFKIEEDSQLLNLVTTLSKVKQEYDKIEVALNDAKNFGYGVVAPSLSELSLEEPEIIKQGKQYGVKLKANAPSLHIIKADISTEVSPIVGNQNQGEEMVKYLLNEFEQNPSEIWESNMFGKSLNDLVKEQLQSKLYTMPDEIRFKIQKTLQKIINEGSNNIITIILILNKYFFILYPFLLNFILNYKRS